MLEVTDLIPSSLDVTLETMRSSKWFAALSERVILGLGAFWALRNGMSE